jgi:uncharacterized protein
MHKLLGMLLLPGIINKRNRFVSRKKVPAVKVEISRIKKDIQMRVKVAITFIILGAIISCSQNGAVESEIVPSKLAMSSNNVADWPCKYAMVMPIPLQDVTVAGFLGQRIDANTQSILAGLESPIPRRFEARYDGYEPPPETERLAADSDLYKWLEGASYVYARTGDINIKSEIDRIVTLIIYCQDDDGYINTQIPPNTRFDNRINHDLYTAGHLFEAAVAHYYGTREIILIDAAQKFADYLVIEYEIGNPYFATIGEKEHSEYELGLLRLSRATGDVRYLNLALSLAGKNRIGPKVTDIHSGTGDGLHAVRVGYFLAGLADLYMETGRDDLYKHLPDLWEELVATRMYLTGGIGIREHISRAAYYLPHNLDNPYRDVAETCASVAMMMFSWRMHAITGHSRYFDIIEKILYNHLLGAVELDHLGTFYYNPLRLVGDISGRTDHGGPKSYRLRLPNINRTSCCITNTWRFFGALPEYVFSYDEQGLFINLYTESQIETILPSGKEVNLSVDTRYPHNGHIEITINNNAPTFFTLHLRIPEWVTHAGIKIGNEYHTPDSGTYFTISRLWNPGDLVTMTVDMPVRVVYSDTKIEANRGQVAIARGPLVYCLENYDVDFPVENARLDIGPGEVNQKIETIWAENLFGGVFLLNVSGWIENADKHTLTPFNTPYLDRTWIMIPYYARASRSHDNRWVTLMPNVYNNENIFR